VSVAPLARALVLAALALLLLPQLAAAHAVLLDARPGVDASVPAAPATAELVFNEPIQIVDPSVDADVVASDGAPVAAGPARVSESAAEILEIPLQSDLPPDTYTVRYRIVGADSHVIVGAYVFGVGVEELGPPFLRDAASQGGPSETGVVGVSGRLFEVASIAALLGLVAFRWLVWRPSLAAAGRGGERLAAWWRDGYWAVFGTIALLAMLAVGWSLVVQTATILGIGVASAIGDTAGVSVVLSDTRFGELIQLRAALLFGAFAIAAWQFLDEHPGEGRSGRDSSRGRRAWGAPARGGAIAVLLLAAIGVLAYQGHASTAPLPALQVGSQVVHTAGAGIWLAGLAATIWVLLRAPRVDGDDGRAVAGLTLRRYGLLALGVLALVVTTGVVRTFGQLDDPSQLWETAYGRTILLKLALLAPIVAIALWSRRVVTALRSVRTPSRAALALIPPRGLVELGVGLVIVAAAALLAGQVPGRI